jgi:hypothetical protein
MREQNEQESSSIKPRPKWSQEPILTSQLRKRNEEGGRTHSIGNITVVSVSINVMIKIKDPDHNVQW